MYSRNMVDYHLIMDMIPAISRMYFLNQLGDLGLSAAQSVGYLLPMCWVCGVIYVLDIGSGTLTYFCAFNPPQFW